MNSTTTMTMTTTLHTDTHPNASFPTPVSVPTPVSARSRRVRRGSTAGLLLAACLGVGTGIAQADPASPPAAGGHGSHGAQAGPAPAGGPAAASALPAVQAEVRKVEAARGLVTLRHADIPNLGMPAMTMVFEVADPALLDGVRTGDRVVFTADHPPGGRMTVRSLAPAS